MIVSVLGLRVRPGCEDELVEAFDRLEVFEHSRRSGGFCRGRILRPLVAGEPFLVIAEWETPADYQGWLDNPVREQLSGGLDEFLDAHPEAGRVYEVAS